MKTKLERAAGELGAVQISARRWAYYDSGMKHWYVVSSSDLEDYIDYLESDDPVIAEDAYSHWCAGSIAREATDAEIAPFL